MKFASLSALALAALAASVSAAPPVNPYQQRLMQLGPVQQGAAIRAAIAGNGNRCGRIERPVYRGVYKNTHMWAARCTPGGEYAAYLGPDGSVQVRPCADQTKLGLPACALPPTTAKAPPRH